MYLLKFLNSLSFFPEFDRTHRKTKFVLFKNCLQSLDESLIDCNTLNYLRNTHKKEINALASFPGSGNTWLRDILQRSTGE